MDFQGNFTQYLSKQPESEDLTQKEMQELQEAIKNSKESAEIEKKRHSLREDEEIKKFSAKPTTNDEDLFEELVIEKHPSPKQGRKETKSPINATVESPPQADFITFQEFLEAPRSSLHIVHRTPVFPTTINSLCGTCELKTCVKHLANYYQKIEALRTQVARKSYSRAPCPKPILPSDYCKTSLLRRATDKRNRDVDKLFEELPDQELYVSRAGRQIKRKVYTEEAPENDSDPEFTYSAKKIRADFTDLKITVDIPYIPHESQDEVKSVSRASKTRKESPKRQLVKKFNSRSEELFDKMRKDEEKRKLQEEEMEKFEKTLPQIEETEEDMLFIEDSPVKENEHFVRKRVVPPIPTKRGGRAKRATKEVTEKKGSQSPPDSPVLKRYTNLGKTTQNKPKSKLRTQKSNDSITSEEPSTSKLEYTPCPICDKQFLQSEIQNHAADCGIEDDMPEEPTGTNRTSVKTITCELCDKVFIANTDYEVHFKLCIGSKVTDL